MAWKPDTSAWSSGDPISNIIAPATSQPSTTQAPSPASQVLPAVTTNSETQDQSHQNHQNLTDQGYFHVGDGQYAHISQVPPDLLAIANAQAEKLYPSNPLFGSSQFGQNHRKLAQVLSNIVLGASAYNPGTGPQSIGQSIAQAARMAMAPEENARQTALERNQYVNTQLAAARTQQAAQTEEELKLSQIAKNNEGTPVGEPREDGKGGTFQILNTPRGLISVPYPVQRPNSPNVVAPNPNAQAPSGTPVAGSIAAPPSSGSSASTNYAPFGTPIGQKPSEEDKNLADYLQTSGLPNTAQGREQARTDLFYRQHPSDAPIGSDGAQSKNAIITSQLKKAGIDPSLYSVAASDSVTAANAKQSAAEKALSDLRAQQSNERAARLSAVDIASKKQNMESKADENVVAYDPNYVNADGSKGGNVVMPRGQAEANSLSHYKVDAALVNANVAGFNDVQTKINQLAAVTNDPNQMSKVQPDIAAAMLKHDRGITLGAFGMSVDTSMINARLYQEDVGNANQATRNYVTATIAAHEAMTQLPRLQTFGKSNRMSQQQMEASQAMLPAPGDDASLAAQKMQSLQTTIDPLRKQMPHMQGAELIPTWAEQNQNRSANPRASQSINPADVVRTGNLNGKKIYQLKNGTTVDGQGNQVNF